jgi:hypothetical protein
MSIQSELQQAFIEWRNTRQLIDPPPERLTYNEQVNTWWETTRVWWYIILGCLIIAAGSRTGWGFYVVNEDEGFGVILGAILAFIAVVGVDGFVAFYGLQRNRKVQDELKPHERFVEGVIPGLSAFTGLSISGLSGMKFSINIAESIKSSLGAPIDWTLSFMMGAGFTFIMYGFSEFVGRLKWNYENMPTILDSEYNRRLSVYNSRIQVEWENSPEYLLIMGEKEKEAAELKWDIDNASYGRRTLQKQKRELELELERKRAEAEIEGLVSGKIRTNSYRNSQDNGTSKASLIREYLQSDHGYFNVSDIPIHVIQGWIEENYGYEYVPSDSSVSEVRTAWIEKQNA